MAGYPTGVSNKDLRYELEPQNSRKAERTQFEASKGERQFAAKGYTTLDQASNDRYEQKERKTLSPECNTPTRR